jgi:hypothetical protein
LRRGLVLAATMTGDNGHHDKELPPGWTETGIARLLERFFAAEMKPPRPSMAMPLPVATAPKVTSRRSPRRWVVPLSFVAVLSCGWLLSLSPVAVSPAAKNSTAAPLRVEIESAGIPFRVEQVSFAGDSGLFAQRNEWRQSSGEYLEPQSGTWVEWTSAELAIEVEPVEQFDGNPEE